MLRALNDVQYRNEVGIEAYEEKMENGELLNIFEVILANYPYTNQDILNLVSESSESVINQMFMEMLNNASAKSPLEKIDCTFVLITLSDFAKVYCEDRKITEPYIVFEELVKCTYSYLSKWIVPTGAWLDWEDNKLKAFVGNFNENYKLGTFDYLFK